MSNKTIHFLALHGFTGCGEDFREFSPLCDSRIQWHCPDLPGHGKSATENASIADTLASIKLLSNRLPKEERRVLLGYSMGARAALLYAIRESSAPWDALILISANPGIQSARERMRRAESDALLAQRIIDEGVAKFLSYWKSVPIIASQQNASPQTRALLATNRLRNSAHGLARSLRQFGQGSHPNLWPELSQLTIPTLLITGEDDRKYTEIAQKMEQMIPNSQHVTIQASGHMPHAEQPAGTAAALNAFLREYFSD